MYLLNAKHSGVHQILKVYKERVRIRSDMHLQNSVRNNKKTNFPAEFCDVYLYTIDNNIQAKQKQKNKTKQKQKQKKSLSRYRRPQIHFTLLK